AVGAVTRPRQPHVRAEVAARVEPERLQLLPAVAPEALLDLDAVAALPGADAAPDLDRARAAEADEEGPPVGVVDAGLLPPVGEAEPRLEAGQRDVVDERVLRPHRHAPVPVGDPLGLVEVGGNPPQRRPEAVRRVALEAELGDVDPHPAAGEAPLRRGAV